jgi:N-glycosylase/DNA lyase
LYESRKAEIKGRLREFEELGQRGTDGDIFRELCFCILTANTSAQMGMRVMEEVGGMVSTAPLPELRDALKGCSCRFYNMRSEFIVATRERLREECPEGLKGRLASFDDPHKRRDFLVRNVKGFGYKEASHFLRNMGFKGYAILDKHIMRCLHEYGVVEDTAPPKSRGAYLEVEARMKGFAEDIGVDFDELDLLLWSRQTGKVLK